MVEAVQELRKCVGEAGMSSERWRIDQKRGNTFQQNLARWRRVGGFISTRKTLRNSWKSHRVLILDPISKRYNKSQLFLRLLEAPWRDFGLEVFLIFLNLKLIFFFDQNIWVNFSNITTGWDAFFGSSFVEPCSRWVLSAFNFRISKKIVCS